MRLHRRQCKGVTQIKEARAISDEEDHLDDLVDFREPPHRPHASGLQSAPPSAAAETSFLKETQDHLSVPPQRLLLTSRMLGIISRGAAAIHKVTRLETFIVNGVVVQEVVGRRRRRSAPAIPVGEIGDDVAVDTGVGRRVEHDASFTKAARDVAVSVSRLAANSSSSATRSESTSVHLPPQIARPLAVQIHRQRGSREL